MTTEAKPVGSLVESGAQVQQMFNVECVTPDFSEAAIFNIQFLYSGAQQKISLKFPLTLNKFIEPAEMDSPTFFQRWKALGQPNQESQTIFKAQYPMDGEQAKAKLLGFCLSVCEGIDPNPENFVSAGILHTRNEQVGVLVRLEPSKQAQMYRLTIRASKDPVAKILCDLLSSQF